MKLLLFVVFCLFVFSIQKKTLVVLDKEDLKVSHSQFFKILKERGHELTFQNRGKKIQLETYGEYLYDNMIIMSPKADSKNIQQLISRRTFIKTCNRLCRFST